MNTNRGPSEGHMLHTGEPDQTLCSHLIQCQQPAIKSKSYETSQSCFFGQWPPDVSMKREGFEITLRINVWRRKCDYHHKNYEEPISMVESTWQHSDHSIRPNCIESISTWVLQFNWKRRVSVRDPGAQVCFLKPTAPDYGARVFWGNAIAQIICISSHRKNFTGQLGNSGYINHSPRQERKRINRFRVVVTERYDTPELSFLEIGDYSETDRQPVMAQWNYCGWNQKFVSQWRFLKPMTTHGVQGMKQESSQELHN